MKLIIQIPCHNEAATLPDTLAALPREVAGFDQVEWLVIDDGSTDETAQLAREAGADHLVRLTRRRGLARAFSAGIDAALHAGADVIVNTDGDNQYSAACIPSLTAPIIRGEADIVVGQRPIDSMHEFSWLKKRLQILGSRVVERLSGARVPDATSGFRAFSRDAALRLTVLTEYTYTLETLLQAGHEKLAVQSVPVETNSVSRPSRLMSSTTSYVLRSIAALTRVYTVRHPLRVFTAAGAIAFALGLILATRYLILMVWYGEGTGHIQSVILSGLLLNVAVLLWMIGLLADTIRANRVLAEQTLYRLRKLELATSPKEAAKPPGADATGSTPIAD